MKFADLNRIGLVDNLEIIAVDADDNILEAVSIVVKYVFESRGDVLSLGLTYLHDKLKEKKLLNKVDRYETIFPQKT